jgi:hypothetical protein
MWIGEWHGRNQRTCDEFMQRGNFVVGQWKRAMELDLFRIERWYQCQLFRACAGQWAVRRRQWGGNNQHPHNEFVQCGICVSSDRRGTMELVMHRRKWRWFRKLFGACRGERRMRFGERRDFHQRACNKSLQLRCVVDSEWLRAVVVVVFGIEWRLERKLLRAIAIGYRHPNDGRNDDPREFRFRKWQFTGFAAGDVKSICHRPEHFILYS